MDKQYDKKEWMMGTLNISPDIRQLTREGAAEAFDVLLARRSPIALPDAPETPGDPAR